MKKPFSELQQRVYDLLSASPGADVEIYKLYEAAYQVNVHKVQRGQLILGESVRSMQQRLGSVIARVNDKLDEEGLERVVPGRVKQTYRLSQKAE